MIGSLLFISGCLSSSSVPFIPIQQAVLIDGVPIIKQQDKQCAAAALAMGLQSQQIHITESVLRDWVFTPGRDGALPPDLSTAVRRAGGLSWPVKSYDSLYNSIQNKRPVVVLVNLGLNWWPKWHYGTVVGVDPIKETIRMHAGLNRPEVWEIQDFLKRWQPLKDSVPWAISITPAAVIPEDVTATEALRAAVGLEKAAMLEPASRTYETIVKRWPENCIAYIGKGNTAYKRQQFPQAQEAWQKASTFSDCKQAAIQNLETL